MLFGLTVLDLSMIAIYFAGMIAVGLWAARSNVNSEEFFLAGRRFGKLVQTFASFGQGTSSDNAVGTTTTTYTNGASGVWSSLLHIFGTPAYWLIAPWYRRMRLLTLGDFFKLRYRSSAMAIAYALIATLGAMAFIAAGVKAMSLTVMALTPKTVEQMTEVERVEHAAAQQLSELQSRDYSLLTPQQQEQLRQLREQSPRFIISHINEEILVAIVSIVIILYGAIGGLRAAFLTDLVQGLFIIVLSVLLLPFAWAKISRLHGGNSLLDAFPIMHRELPDSYFQLFGSAATVQFTWFYIVTVSILAIANVAVQPNMLVAIGSAKNEYAARFGFVSGSLIKRAVTVLWALTALFLLVLYGSTVHNSDLVWGYATRDLLAPVGLGLVGLMIACLMSAMMSTADCWMITASGILTQNFYRPIFPQRSEMHYVRVGQIVGAAVIIGGALLATRFDTMLELLKFLWRLFISFAGAFWLGIIWQRASRPAAWTSIIASALIFLALPALLPMIGGFRARPELLVRSIDQTVVNSYVATEGDVAERERMIQAFEQAQASGAATPNAPRPEPLQVDQTFTRQTLIPGQSIYWQQGVRNGQGQGLFKLDLWLLNQLGFDLSKRTYAFNESLNNINNLVVPFGLMLLVSLILPDRGDEQSQRLFVTLRTRVAEDPEDDARRLQAALARPADTRSVKLFPNSSWEFKRWNAEDVLGLIATTLVILAILAGFKFLLWFGQ